MNVAEKYRQTSRPLGDIHFSEYLHAVCFINGNNMKEEKVLQIVNLSPSESWIERIVEVHPMKQVAVMSVVQVLVFGFMMLSFWLIGLFI